MRNFKCSTTSCQTRASQALEFIFCNSVLHRNRDKFKEKIFWSKDSTNYQNIYYSLNTNICWKKIKKGHAKHYNCFLPEHFNFNRTGGGNANCTLAILGAAHPGNTFEGQNWISAPKANESLHTTRSTRTGSGTYSFCPKSWSFSPS